MNAPVTLPIAKLQRLRAQFPILTRQIHGRPLVYLDNAASAQKPQAVLDVMMRYYTRQYANVHRGMHTLSNEITQAYESARDTVQAFLGAARREEIVFTSGGTEAINLVAQSFVAPQIHAGDEIVLTQMEHHSNIVPWHFLRERKGARLKFVPITADGGLDMDALEAALSKKTRLLAITHMSNVLGSILPIREICALAHARRIPVLVDGCQGAVHLDVDVQALDCDFYIATGHKLYGPSGVGVLFGKYEHLAHMRPYQGGGEMIAHVREDAVAYADPPQRFESGTPPIVQAIGLGAACQFLREQDIAALRAHEHDLLTQLQTRLGDIPGIRLLGTCTPKAAIQSFVHEHIHAHDLATLLDRYAIAVRAGHHCAEPLMQALGVTASLRASFAFYNTNEDVTRLIDGLIRAIAFFDGKRR